MAASKGTSAMVSAGDAALAGELDAILVPGVLYPVSDYFVRSDQPNSSKDIFPRVFEEVAWIIMWESSCPTTMI